MMIKKSFLLLTLYLFFGCSQSKNNPTLNNSTKSQKKTVKRFFNDNSFWNQPISKDQKIDSKSEYWINLLERDPSGENIGLNIKSHTIPIYEVDSKNLIHRKVKQTPHYYKDGKLHTLHGHEPEFDEIGVPIALSIKPSAGSDRHIAVLDWEENRVWEMFAVDQINDTTWSSATGMTFPLNGSGVFNLKDFAVNINQSIHGYGPGVASGIPIIAGVIRYDEVMSGKIRHKLSGALRYVAFQEYTFPAIWTDGNFDGGIPEGATIQLDPELDLSQFDLTDGEKVVAKALQEYGLVIVDFSIGTTIRAEWLDGNEAKSWDGILRGWHTPGGIKTIPTKHYRVLEVNNIQKGGDEKKEFFMNNLYFKGEPKPTLKY